METVNDLTSLFLHGAGLETQDNPDNVAIGYLTGQDSESGFDTVVQNNIDMVDAALATLPANSKHKATLLSVRGFSFTEYLQLFNLNISERSFQDFAAFRYLYLSEEKVRRRLIYQLRPTHEDYRCFLIHCLTSHNALHLPTFFFEASYEGSHRSQCPYNHNITHRRGEIKNVGANL